MWLTARALSVNAMALVVASVVLALRGDLPPRFAGAVGAMLLLLAWLLWMPRPRVLGMRDKRGAS